MFTKVVVILLSKMKPNFRPKFGNNLKVVLQHVSPNQVYEKIQGGQDHFFPKEMLISLSILKLHKNP